VAGDESCLTHFCGSIDGITQSSGSDAKWLLRDLYDHCAQLLMTHLAVIRTRCHDASVMFLETFSDNKIL
jgi:hypothetical protein